MISKKEIEHLKDLARIMPPEMGTETLAKDLGEILGYVDELKEADVSNAPEMTHALEGIKNVFRKDEEITIEGGGFSPGEITDAFPEKEKNYLKVQPIL